MVFYNQLKSYQNARETLHSTRQIVLLYDTAIRYIQQAKQAIEGSQFGERFNLLEKAKQIIIGLNGALDHANGGEIAKILSGFYSNIEQRITKLHQTNNLGECDNIIKELKEMRDSWAKIDEQFTAGKLGSGGSSTPACNIRRRRRHQGLIFPIFRVDNFALSY